MLWWTLYRLKSKKPYTRSEAIRKLSISRDPRAVEPLVAALQDREGGMRQAAVEALGKISDPQAVEPLVALLLRDANYNIWQTAVETLESIGWKPLTPIERALCAVAKGRYNEAVAEGAVAVGPLMTTLKYYAKYYSTWDTDARRAVMKALIQIGPAAVKPLSVMLQDGNDYVRREAVEALGEIGDRQAIESLVAALQDKDGRVLWAAAVALKTLGWQPVNDTQRALYAGIEENREEAQRLGKSAIAPLIMALSSPQNDVRRAAAEKLLRIGPAGAQLLTIALRQQRHKYEKLGVGAIFDAMKKVSNSQVVPPLVTFAIYNESYVKEAIDLLHDILIHDMENVDSESLHAISRLDSLVHKEIISTVGAFNKIRGYEVIRKDVIESDPTADYGGTTWIFTLKVDCSAVRLLAQQELIKRGIKP